MIDPKVLRDASEYLKDFYSEPDRKCLDILYQFTKGSNDDRTMIIIHKRYDKNWGQPTSYSYLDLAICADTYRRKLV